MADLIIPEAFNLFVGGAGPDNSKHLVIKSVKLPELEEMTQEHHPGGSYGSLEIGGLGLKPLTCTFKLTGYDKQTMSRFGIGGRVSYPYTVYGLSRSKITGRAVALKAVIWGRLTKMSRPDLKRGDLHEIDHEIKEITHYEEWHDDMEKYSWDFATSVWKVDGKIQNQDELDYLSIASPGGGLTFT